MQLGITPTKHRQPSLDASHNYLESVDYMEIFSTRLRLLTTPQGWLICRRSTNMPTYEYECKECHHQLEAEQRIKDEPLKECPACHKPALERLISASSFQLKGGGWYKDAYSSKTAASTRTSKDVENSLTKAIDKDKAATAAAAPAASSDKSSGGDK